jgi:hypothetical protein
MEYLTNRLEIKFFDYCESYVNGILKESTSQWRRNWGNSSSEINIKNESNNDDNNYFLRPLEIRSFRINLYE